MDTKSPKWIFAFYCPCSGLLSDSRSFIHSSIGGRLKLWRAILVLVLIFTCMNLIIQLFSPNLKFVHPKHVDEIYLKLAHNVFAMTDTDCLKLAQEYPEPYTPQYEKLKIDLDGPMYATYKWSKPITKKQIDWQRNLTENRRIPGNTRVFFKVKDSMLYIDERDVGYTKVFPEGMDSDKSGPLRERFDRTMELMLVALHVYDIPDLDFVVELSDAVHPSKPSDPALSYSLRAFDDSEGFTIPSYAAFSKSIGHSQFLLLRECMSVKYPVDKRIKKAVWRGTTTGFHMSKGEDVPKNDRVKLASTGIRRSDILDVGIVDYLQVNKSNEELMKKLEELAPLQSRMPMSEFSEYAVVLDIDGNAWSDRLPALLMGNAVVLKQEYSRWLDYLFSTLRASDTISFFKTDQSDLVAQASALVREYALERSSWLKRLEKMTEFAQEHVSHAGVIRAMAYALTSYASFQDWDVQKEEGYIVIPKNRCCKYNAALPKLFIEEIAATT